MIAYGYITNNIENYDILLNDNKLTGKINEKTKIFGLKPIPIKWIAPRAQRSQKVSKWQFPFVIL